MRTLQRLLLGMGPCWGMIVVIACGTNDGAGLTRLTRNSGVSTAVRDRQSATGAVERFNCADLQEVRVRFSNPGFVDAIHVGLYYNYIGLPAGEKHLEIAWDEVSEPEKFERIDLGSGEVQRFNDALFDLEGIVEHTYRNISREEMRQVRARLRIRNFEDDCSRVRRIRVMPPEELDPPAPVPPPGPSIADLSVAANDVPDPVMVNNSFDYIATATNLGPGSATGVLLRFIIAAAGSPATFLSAPPGCVNSGAITTCTIGALAVGASANFTVTYQAASASGVTLGVVVVSGNETDPNPGNNSAILTTTIN